MPMSKTILKAKLKAMMTTTVSYTEIDPDTGAVTPKTQKVEPADQILNPMVEIISHIQTHADISISPATTPAAVLTAPSAIVSPLAVVAGGIPGPGSSLPTPCPISVPSGLIVNAPAVPEVSGGIQ